MTKAQVRTKFRELQKENRKREDELFEKALICGALDLENYENDYILSRTIMHVICKTMSDDWGLFSEEEYEDAENLKCFI